MKLPRPHPAIPVIYLLGGWAKYPASLVAGCAACFGFRTYEDSVCTQYIRSRLPLHPLLVLLGPCCAVRHLLGDRPLVAADASQASESGGLASRTLQDRLLVPSITISATRTSYIQIHRATLLAALHIRRSSLHLLNRVAICVSGCSMTRTPCGYSQLRKMVRFPLLRLHGIFNQSSGRRSLLLCPQR
jgi:hypothetical protein